MSSPSSPSKQKNMTPTAFILSQEDGGVEDTFAVVYTGCYFVLQPVKDFLEGRGFQPLFTAKPFTLRARTYGGGDVIESIEIDKMWIGYGASDPTLYDAARIFSMEIKAEEKFLILDEDEKSALIAMFPALRPKYGTEASSRMPPSASSRMPPRK